MARARRNNIDSHIAGLVQAHVSELVNALTRAVRTNLADELKSYFSGTNGQMLQLKGRRGVRPGTKRRMDCLAPSCKNLSKGPRFRYLCPDHMNSSKKDVEAWRKARKAESA
jgi:hypothetical protein